MIVVEPTDGLCNRLRVLHSAVQLARDLDQRLVLLWRKDRFLGSRFRELFEPPKQVDLLVEMDDSRLSRLREKLVRRIIRGCVEIRLADAELEPLSIPAERVADFCRDSGKRHFHFFTNRCFHGADRPFVAPRPVKAIRRIVDRCDTEGRVGVHVRRTDHAIAIEHSPLHAFVEAMEHELARDAGTRFFLATDSAEVERELQAVFPGRIALHPKRSHDRSDPVAIRDAVVDLFALAKCRSIIGSRHSSFSKHAGLIGNIAVSIAGSRGQGHDARVLIPRGDNEQATGSFTHGCIREPL